MPGPPVPHHLPKFAQVYFVHCIGDAVHPSHPLTPSSPALSLSQHPGTFSMSRLFAYDQSTRPYVFHQGYNLFSVSQQNADLCSPG